jgi:hypothetical protein
VAKITDPELLDAGKVLKRLTISTLTGVIGVAVVDLGVVGCAGCIYLGELLLEKIGYHFEKFVSVMDSRILGVLLLIVSVFAVVLASRDMYLYLVRSERKRAEEQEHAKLPVAAPTAAAQRQRGRTQKTGSSEKPVPTEKAAEQKSV